MVRLTLEVIEARVKPLAGREPYDRSIIFDLLLAYGRFKGNFTRFRNDLLNVVHDLTHEVAQTDRLLPGNNARRSQSIRRTAAHSNGGEI